MRPPSPAAGPHGFTLLETMIAGAVLAVLVLLVISFTGTGLQSQRTMETRFSFDQLSSAISLMMESPSNCSGQLGNPSVVMRNSTGQVSFLGTSKVPSLTVPGYGRLETNTQDAYVQGYRLVDLAVESLKRIKSDARGMPVTLGILRLGLSEDGVIAPVRSLGQPTLYREFYLVLTVNPSNGQIEDCHGGRVLSGEEVLTPNLYAIPPRKGLVLKTYVAQAGAGGGAGASRTLACPNGGFLMSADLQATGADGTAFPRIPFFPSRYFYGVVNNANNTAFQGAARVDLARRTQIEIRGGNSGLSRGANARFTCLEIGEP